ncbi:hypothetical protein RhiJN_07654 [Ceratobasidium sp. AG-Ba]|nr:hypothetical protein RhiJN_07654 [Ceratobasidium sp. AG-Ba]
MPQKSLFGPTTTEIPTEGSVSSTAWNVTVPRSADLVKPAAQLLDELLPAKQRPIDRPVAQLFKDVFDPKPSSEDDVEPTGNSYADVLKRNLNRARTANNAEAYRSTGSAILDAFSGLNSNSSAQIIHKHLATSWSQSPELTLRIIWNMRSIHEGYNNKYGFYHAFGWLYKKHPRTAIKNLSSIVERLCERTIKRQPKQSDGEFEIVNSEVPQDEKVIGMPHGYYKDLLNIVVLAMRNELGNPSLSTFKTLNVPPIKRKSRTKAKWASIKKTKQHQNRKFGVEVAQGFRAEASERADAARAEKARADRKAKRQTDFAVLKAKLERDKPFLALYATVAQIFADALAHDVALLKRIETASEDVSDLQFELTSASKWAPTLGAFHDRATNISTAIALILHARGHMPDLPLTLSDDFSQESAHTLRSYYRRWIVSPLRRFTEVTETKMSSRKWDEVDYRRVPSQCMKSNKETFFKRDEKRFTDYLVDVAVGKSKISGATLLPHGLLIEALRATRLTLQRTGKKSGSKLPTTTESLQRMRENVIDAQWNSLLERMRESGTLDNSLAIVDVSGSMGCIGYPPHKLCPQIAPIFPAVALGVMVAQLAQPPFSDMFITFSSTPELLKLQPGSLAERAQWMVGTEWGVNTDYEAVFLKLLLPTAVEHNIKPEDMLKRLFVFSDMQFDQSSTKRSGEGWQTSHERVVEAYRKAGYEAPEIIYWDLQSSNTKPVLQASEPPHQSTSGTAILTGFSPNMMKLFMNGEILKDEFIVVESQGNITPLAVMERALSKSCYDTLKVYD